MGQSVTKGSTPSLPLHLRQFIPHTLATVPRRPPKGQMKSRVPALQELRRQTGKQTATHRKTSTGALTLCEWEGQEGFLEEVT